MFNRGKQSNQQRRRSVHPRHHHKLRVGNPRETGKYGTGKDKPAGLQAGLAEPGEGEGEGEGKGRVLK